MSDVETTEGQREDVECICGGQSNDGRPRLDILCPRRDRRLEITSRQTIECQPVTPGSVRITNTIGLHFCPQWQKDGQRYEPTDEELGAMLVRELRKIGHALTIDLPKHLASIDWSDGSRHSAIRLAVNGVEFFSIDFTNRGDA